MLLRVKDERKRFARSAPRMIAGRRGEIEKINLRLQKGDFHVGHLSRTQAGRTARTFSLGRSCQAILFKAMDPLTFLRLLFETSGTKMKCSIVSEFVLMIFINTISI